MKLVVAIVALFLLVSCEKSAQFYSDNCVVMDTVVVPGYAKFGHGNNHTTVLSGNYTQIKYKCKVSTLNIESVYSVNISFNPSPIKYK